MLSGSNARHFSTTVSQRSPDQLKRIINFTSTIQNCLSTKYAVDYPQSLINANILGQGNLNMVRGKSGKSQGILLSIICGNPVRIHALIIN